MTRTELTAAVALNFIKEQLENEREGTQRICMLGLDPEMVRAIATAAVADPEIDKYVLVRISSYFDAQAELPADLRSDESITHWRHCKLPDGMQAVLFATSQEELQRNDKSVEKITRIETDKLRMRYDAWVSCAGLSERYLDQTKKSCLETALRAANETHTARTIGDFADFVLAVKDAVISTGLPLQKAVDNALPALRLPRYAGYFDRIPENRRSEIGEWKKIFRRLNQRTRPLLVRENDKGESIDEVLGENFNSVKELLEDSEKDAVQRFLIDDLSADTWTQSQRDLTELDWRSISEIFEGLKKTQSQPLGERTIKFFDDEFDDQLDNDERALLSSKFPKDSTEDIQIFFERHQEHLARSKGLYGTWEKYIYNNPQPFNDFLVGLIATLHRLRDRTDDVKLSSKKLVVRIPRSREKSFWRSKNAKIARYFAYRYRGIQDIFGANITFEFGKLYEFYFPITDIELAAINSRSRDARSLKFELEIDPEGAKSKMLFGWEMPIDALATAMASDLLHIANLAGNHALLSTAEIVRQSTSTKGRIQRVDLCDLNTVRDAASGSAGKMVAPNRSCNDCGGNFLAELNRLVGLIPPNGVSAIQDAFEDFQNKYTQAIRQWVSKDGEGISSGKLLAQAKAYGTVFETLKRHANNDRARENLWKECLRIGVANVGGGASAAIILPWHPLRLAEIHVKVYQTAALLEIVLAAEQEDIFRAELLFHQKSLELQSVYYPEVCVGFDEHGPILLSVAESYFDYSLAEQPKRNTTNDGEDSLDIEPGIAAKAFSAVGEQFLNLLPHERTNFSVVLYNAESKALPSALASELSSKVEQENELQCDLLLTHSKPQRMRRIYEQQNVAVSDDSGSVMASEAARSFLSRLRVGFLDESRITTDDTTRAADLVALQDVIARNADVVWKKAPGDNYAEIKTHVPYRWSRHRPVGVADTATSVYLAAPVQPEIGQTYLNAIQLFLRGDNALINDVIPAREVNFKNSQIAGIFKNTHQIGEWVVNFDELVDRRLLANNGVQVIRHIHDRDIDRNITVSTTCKPRLLNSLLRERLNRIDPSIVNKYGDNIVNRLTDQANLLSGHVVMRAARYGHFVNELIGIVLSMEELKKVLGGEILPIGWYFLDDFASWFGQKEEQIADIMAIAPRIVNGERVLRITISEAKFVTSQGYQGHVKKSAKQLGETISRLVRALSPGKNRIDRETWLHQIGDFMIEGMHPFDPNMLGGWDLHRWSHELREDNVPITLVGYSHIFVHDEDEYVDAGGPTFLNGRPHCFQQIFDKSHVSRRLRAFAAGDSNAKDIGSDEVLSWNAALVSRKVDESTLDDASADELRDESECFENQTVSHNGRASIDYSAPTQATDKTSATGTDEEETAPNETLENDGVATPVMGNQLTKYDIPNFPSEELQSWLSDRCEDNGDSADREWLKDVVGRLQRALRGYDLTAKLIGSRLTPNAALVRFRGSDDLTVPKIEKRRQELLTSHAIDVINVQAAPMEVVIIVRRPNRAVLSLSDLWLKRSLPPSAPDVNTSLLLGAQESDGELLYLNVGEGFAGLHPHGPHTLIAGETGSGKGVLVQCLLLDICATNAPTNARIKMIDPKAGIDFPWLRRMPHLDGDLITTREEAVETLQELVVEMERRNKLLAYSGVTKLASYNRKVAPSERLPRIWVFHDELADWMMIDDYRAAVELNANRLGVKSRAAGINLVFVTQRPDKDALPMQLRANLTNRLVLKVADKRNSILVLDEPGAERLLGRGHLGAKLSGESKVIFAQVPFADEDEIAELAGLIATAWEPINKRVLAS